MSFVFWQNRCAVFRTAILFFGGIAWMLTTSVTFAADKTWTNADGTFDWNQTSNNWTGGPWNNANNDGAIFTNTGIGTIHTTGGITVRSMDFQNTTGNYIFMNANLSLTNAGTSSLGPNEIRIGDAGITVTILSNLNSNNGMTKTGPGTLMLGNSINYSNSTTTASGGTLAAADPTVFRPISQDNTVTVQSGASLRFTNNFTSTGLRTLNLNGAGVGGLGALIFDAAATATTWNAGTTCVLQSDSSIGTYNTGGVGVTLGYVIGDGGNGRSLTKVGVGTLTLGAANTYGGSTTVANGTLRNGINNALPTTTTLVMGDVTNSLNVGTYRLQGFNQVVAGLTNAGSNSTHMVINGSTATASTLTINNPVSLNYGAQIANGPAGSLPLSLVKLGSGTQSLSGTNSYTGTTTITAGRLLLASNDALPTVSNVIMNGGMLGIASGLTANGGTLGLLNNSIIDFSSPTATTTINFDNSAAVPWTVGRVISVNGWNGTPVFGGGTSRLFVGTDVTGLTAGQLSQFQFAGFPMGATILSTGEVVPVPEPASVMAICAAGMGVGVAVRRWRSRKLLSTSV